MKQNKDISVKKTVLFLEAEGIFCHCDGDYYKTCPLKNANDLPCQEAIIGIHFIDRNSEDLADPVIRSLNSEFNKLKHSIRHLETKLKIR